MKHILPLIPFFLFFISCSLTNSGKKGDFVLQYSYHTPESSRHSALFPQLPKPDVLNLILSPDSGDPVTISLDNNDSLVVALDTGHWTMSVTGLVKGNPVYTGNADFQIEVDKQTPVDLLLVPQQTGNGSVIIQYYLQKNSSTYWPTEDIIYKGTLVNKETGDGPELTLITEGDRLLCRSGDITSGFFVLIFRATGAETGLHFPDLSRTNAIYVYDYLVTEHEEELIPSSFHASPGNTPFLNPYLVDANSIRLNWALPADSNIAFWDIEKSEEGGVFYSLVEELLPKIIEYTDNTVQTGKKYQYRIRAGNPYDEVSEWIQTGIVES